MEKRRPHYDLCTVQKVVKLRGADAFTATALIGARSMGLSADQAIEIVCSMKGRDFYKSMTIHASSSTWQDVYHLVMPDGKTAYVKVTLREDGSVAIQFKEK